RLVRAHAVVRKGERVGEGLLGLEQRVGRLDLVDQLIDGVVQRAGHALALELGVDGAGVAADQIDEHQLRRESESGEIRLLGEEKRIEQQLKQIALQFLRSVERFELQIEVDGLHFLDGHQLRVTIDRQAV